MSERELLFSVTANDCDWSYTKGSGKGGQKRNKTSSAVHCKHRDSGATGYAEDTRSQHKNKALAFERMAKSEKFKKWHKLEVARKTGVLDNINREVKKELNTNVRVEGVDEDGKWVTLPDSPKK